jgi:cytochrome P450
MDAFIKKELEKRYDDYRANLKLENQKQSKSVIDLALQSYLAENPEKATQELNKTFRIHAIRQIRLFLFAGNDTTSSTICYTYYLLSINPEAQRRIREEHDLVFGTDRTVAPSLILKQPHLINQLPYTTAVLKESMRLFPGASSIRQGLEGIDVADDQGNQYPTGGTMIWILHQAMHRDPAYWKRADEFLPERWLVEPEDPLYPVKGAWRPFKFGPRNCIGQGLVMLELRVVLALTVREFDIAGAYEEWDRMHPGSGIKKVDGERAYQIEKGGAHPANRFPCRVSLRI